MLGYSHDQFIEKSIWEIGSLKDIVANKDKFSELQKNKFVRYENLPLETANGRKINVEFVSNVYLVNGKKVIQCIIRDISDRIEAQDALIFSETRFDHLFESIKDGILFLDAKTGIITAMNPFLTDLFGFAKENFIGKEIWGISLFKSIIPNAEKFKELNQKEFIKYQDIEIETAENIKIKIEFISTMYFIGNHKVIQCFIHEIPNS
jgi:two-component system CheB/CheR fusion protein